MSCLGLALTHVNVVIKQQLLHVSNSAADILLLSCVVFTGKMSAKTAGMSLQELGPFTFQPKSRISSQKFPGRIKLPLTAFNKTASTCMVHNHTARGVP